ncbi:MAG: dephospho-CoA kinase [Mucilaginibacter polytrichastri]|nr:dephospho-CoA kinase [Mucilaginibacter polytrichastri]
MIRVGITGGIGSGKTIISKVFVVLGIPVFYADAAAKKVMTEDPELVKAMKAEFGEKAYIADGQLDRGYIASQVFDDKERLEKLNSIVHPATFRAMDAWTAEQKNVPYVLKEAALLYESGSYKDCDFTILVIANEAVKIARIKDRDGLNEEQIRTRMARQMTDEEKRPLADFIIHNSGNDLVVPQVLNIHEQILAKGQHA